MPLNAKLLIRDVRTVAPSDTVLQATEIMANSNIGSVVVVEMHRPVGLFTERDLVQRVIAKGLEPKTTKVSQVMTLHPVTVESTEPLDKVFERLAEGKFRHLPVTEGGEVVGIVSLTDLTKVLKIVYQEEKYIQYFADILQSK